MDPRLWLLVRLLRCLPRRSGPSCPATHGPTGMRRDIVYLTLWWAAHLSSPPTSLYHCLLPSLYPPYLEQPLVYGSFPPEQGPNEVLMKSDYKRKP